jgi:hypothetical protein
MMIMISKLCWPGTASKIKKMERGRISDILSNFFSMYRPKGQAEGMQYENITQPQDAFWLGWEFSCEHNSCSTKCPDFPVAKAFRTDPDSFILLAKVPGRV